MFAFFSSNPDRNILRGQSSRQGGRHRAVTRNNTATRWPTPEEAVGMSITEATEETVRANEKAFLSTWDYKVFTVSSAFAILVDPLYLYTYIVKDDPKCLTWDDRLVLTFLAVRTATDLVYIADFVLYVIYLRRIRRKLKVLRVPSKQKRHDFRTPLLRLYTALPVAQCRLTCPAAAGHAARVSSASADLLAQQRPATRESRQLARTDSSSSGPPRRETLANGPLPRESRQLARTYSPSSGPPRRESLANLARTYSPSSGPPLRESLAS
ncbi:hypothetical protein ACLB2K_008445 [Fragaria x ananassa]